MQIILDLSDLEQLISAISTVTGTDPKIIRHVIHDVLFATEKSGLSAVAQASLSLSVDALELSIRATNCLSPMGITTLKQLSSTTEAELLRTPNFGRKCLREIKEGLARYQLGLGMDFSSGDT